MGDVVRIKSSEGSYLCADTSNNSSFDSKNTFNFCMCVAQLQMRQLSSSCSIRLSRDIIDKNPKLICEFTLKDENGRESNAVGANAPHMF